MRNALVFMLAAVALLSGQASSSYRVTHTYMLGGESYTIYTGLVALILNIIVASVIQLAMGSQKAGAPAKA